MHHPARLQHLVIGDTQPLLAQLVSQESVAELGIVKVRVKDSVRSMGIRPLTLANRIRQRLVVGLTREAPHPARQLHRYPVDGQVRPDLHTS